MPVNGRVLVVEDEALIRMLAVDMLEEFGYSVDEAGDGAGALEKLRASGADYSFVFLDIGLPDMRGDDLIATIRDMYAKTPLLVASGEDPVDLKTRLEGFVPIGILAKPYSMDQLKSALDTLLGA